MAPKKWTRMRGRMAKPLEIAIFWRNKTEQSGTVELAGFFEGVRVNCSNGAGFDGLNREIHEIREREWRSECFYTRRAQRTQRRQGKGFVCACTYLFVLVIGAEPPSPRGSGAPKEEWRTDRVRQCRMRGVRSRFIRRRTARSSLFFGRAESVLEV